mgnify:CR=1 FL=1
MGKGEGGTSRTLRRAEEIVAPAARAPQQSAPPMLGAIVLAGLGLLLSPTPLTPAVPTVRVPVVQMAHHVNDKGAKKHNSCRPRKSRLSDINRTPPNYPPLPGPQGPIAGPPKGRGSQTVTIAVSPSDDADAVKAKLAAAGASAPEALMFRGTVVTGTLGDCGLAGEESLEVIIA